MTPQLHPLAVDEPSFSDALVEVGALFFQEGAIIVFDEADLHALRAFGLGLETLSGQVFAHGSLGTPAQGKEHPTKHILGKFPQKVRLVLGAVIAGHDITEPVALFQPAVVACCDEGTVPTVRPFAKHPFLDRRIAPHTGIGGAPLQVIVDERLHDRAAEPFAHIRHMVLDA